LSISVTVSNTGEVAGAEVVQLYLHDPVARTVRPRRELKGFARVSLTPRSSARITFELSADRCAIYDPRQGWLVEPGVIDVLIGSSSSDIRCHGQFELVGDVRAVGVDRELATPSTSQPVLATNP
jgi:hypothetical protein